MAKNRVAVLGLDAMPWHYLEKLFEYGVMPFMRSLVNNSFNATLEAYPPVTPPSWSSIMTGVNPGKHGIFGFFYYDRRSWKQRLYTSLDLEYPRVHEMLSMLGCKSIVFNPMPDYPLLPVSKAEIISNLFFTPKPVSSPSDAYKKYFGNENPQEYTTSLTCDVIRECCSVLDVYEKAIEVALKEDYSLLWINLNVPDIVFHRCLEVLDKKHLRKDENLLFSKLDKIIKLLRESNDSLVIVSDHGFSRYDKLVSINDILVTHGFAKSSSIRQVKEVGDYRRIHEEHTGARNLQVVKIPPRVYRLVKKFKLSILARTMLKLYEKISGKIVSVQTSRWIDIERSDAFMPDHCTFGIYLKNKNLVEKVKNILLKYKDYIKFFDSDKFYLGPFIERAPDIVVFPNYSAGYTLGDTNIIGSIVVSGNYQGHHPCGVLIVSSDLDTGLSGRYNETTLPNYVVATIVMGLLKKPLPKGRDKHPLVEKAFAGKVGELDYLSRWKLQKMMYKRIMRCKESLREGVRGAS